MISIVYDTFCRGTDYYESDVKQPWATRKGTKGIIKLILKYIIFMYKSKCHYIIEYYSRLRAQTAKYHHCLTNLIK